MKVMHAMITGYPMYSAAHIILDNIWATYNKRERGAIPHCHIISSHIKDSIVLPRSYKKVTVRPQHATLNRNSFATLLLNQTPTHTEIVDTVNQRKIAFRKAACPDLPEYDPSLPWPSLTATVSTEAPISDDDSAGESDDVAPDMPVNEQAADIPPSQEGSTFDMSSLLTSLRGVIGEENQGLYRRFDEERQRRMAFEEEMRRQHAAMEWERQRHRYAYELEWDERRRYFDQQQNLAPMTRETYDTVFPGEASGLHHYAGDPPAPDSQAYGRFPAPRSISRYPGGSSSGYFNPSTVMDHTPPEQQSFFDSIFGPPPPPPQ